MSTRMEEWRPGSGRQRGAMARRLSCSPEVPLKARRANLSRGDVVAIRVRFEAASSAVSARACVLAQLLACGSALAQGPEKPAQDAVGHAPDDSFLEAP
jgi:hypothetical protein